MDVLILAAGLGSRLSKFTHDIIPKYLINLDHHTGLYYIINYWQKYANNIYLIIHSKYNIITQFYIDNILNDYKNKIIIINYDSSDGTAYTINHLLNTELKTYNIENLLITWCDIFPNEKIEFENIKKSKNVNDIYVFTNGNKCRYKLNIDNEIVPSQDGDVIGIYYFHNYKRFLLNQNCYSNDIVLYLSIIGDIYKYPLKNIIDYGDENKLIDIINNPIKKTFDCRYFNSLEIIDNNKLLKKSINDKGNIIIKNEKDWYKYIYNLYETNLKKNIPKIYKYYEYGFLMEYKKNYIPLYQFLDIVNDMNLKQTILDNIFNKLNILHNIEYKEQSRLVFFNDLKKEIHDKVINRKKIINDLLNYFGNIQYVNDLKILSFENIIEKCKNIIIKYYDALNIYKYSIIIGDCNFSNILINPDETSDIVFIDPRGYYGETKIHGIKEYDISKLFYAISGYDKFNAKYFNIEYIDNENQSIKFNIEPILFDKNITNKYFNKVHKAFIVIHWLSLAEYNKNNIWKCVASYYYGLYLGTLL